jgi:hypothetical protein
MRWHEGNPKPPNATSIRKLSPRNDSAGMLRAAARS